MLRPSPPSEIRRKAYKKGVNADDARRWREENMVAIRKRKREDSLLKKRRVGLLLYSQQVPQQTHYNDASLYTVSIPLLAEGLWSEHPSTQPDVTTHLGKLLSMEQCLPIDEVVKAKVVSRLVDFLGRPDLPQLQFEAAWVLSNVASRSSEHTRVVIEHGAIPKFVELLTSASDDAREQAVWALGYIANDSSSCRDLVLSHKALVPLLSLLHDKSKLSMLRNATWALSNFCCPNPPAPFELVIAALPVLRDLIYVDDKEVLEDACLTLSYLSDGPTERIQAVIDSGVCQRLYELIHHPIDTVLLPALQTVGSILSGDDSQVQIMINYGVISHLDVLLKRSQMRSIKNKTCWAISNITAGNTAQIQAIIESPLVPMLVQYLQLGRFEIQKEAAWAICNATSRGSHEQIRYLVNQGCIEPLCDLLACPNPRIVTVCLLGLDNILKVGEADKVLGMNGGVNLYAHMVGECGGFDLIKNLQTHNTNVVYEKVVKRLNRYWVEEELEHGGHHDGGVLTQGN